MKKKLSVRAAVSLLLSALLFCMPVGAFMANSGNTVDAYAEGTIRRKAAEHRKKTVPKGKQRKPPEQRKALKPGKTQRMGRMKPGKQKPSPEVMRKKRKAGRYPGTKYLNRNVPVKKNVHSIPLTKIVRSARGITAYANM